MSTENAAAATTEENNEPTPYYVGLGYESEDALKSVLSEHGELVGMRESLAAQTNEYNERLSILQSAEHEIDPEIENLAQLKKKGISMDIATKVLSATQEELESNPMETLILAEAVSNPNKFNKLGRKQIEEAIRLKYNLGDDDYTPTALMNSEAFDALEKINNVKKSVVEVKNPYKFASEQKAQTDSVFAERQKLVTSEMDTLTKELTEVTFKDSDLSFALKVSKEELESLKSHPVYPHLSRLYDPSTKEGRQQLRLWAEQQLIDGKHRSGEVVREALKSIRAEAKKEAVKEIHAGQPVTDISRTTSQSYKEENLTATEKYLIDKGITPHTLKNKQKN